MKKFHFLTFALSLVLAVQQPVFSQDSKQTPAKAYAKKAPAKEAPATTIEKDLNEAGTPIPEDDLPTTTLPTDPVDTIGTVKEIDGEQFIVIANEIDKSTGQIVAIVKEYKENQATGGSVLQFILTLVGSGVLGTLLTQLTKTSKMVIEFVNGINRPVRVAFYIAGVLTAAWTGLETGFKFTDFDLIALFTRWLLVFAPTLLVYEYLVRLLVKKKDTA